MNNGLLLENGINNSIANNDELNVIIFNILNYVSLPATEDDKKDATRFFNFLSDNIGEPSTVYPEVQRENEDFRLTVDLTEKIIQSRDFGPSSMKDLHRMLQVYT